MIIAIIFGKTTYKINNYNKSISYFNKESTFLISNLLINTSPKDHFTNDTIIDTELSITERSGRDFINTDNPIKEVTNVCATALAFKSLCSSPDQFLS